MRGAFRFLILEDKGNTTAEKVMDYEVAARILSISENGATDLSYKALADWFSHNHSPSRRKYKKWIQKYIVEKVDGRDRADEIIKKQRAWALESSIIESPSIILNGVRLPTDIQVEDLKYLIMRESVK